MDFDKERITSRTKLLNFVEDITETVKLEDVDVIVSGGRGLGKAENFKLLKELAKVMGTALGSAGPPVMTAGFHIPIRSGTPVKRFAVSSILLCLRHLRCGSASGWYADLGYYCGYQ